METSNKRCIRHGYVGFSAGAIRDNETAKRQMLFKNQLEWSKLSIKYKLELKKFEVCGQESTTCDEGNSGGAKSRKVQEKKKQYHCLHHQRCFPDHTLLTSAAFSSV